MLKNRLIRSATWEGMANIDGYIPDKLYDTYEELAKGGIGAIITGFTSVARDDHYFGGMVRLSGDELISEHKRLTELCHKENCPVIVQIALGEYANGTEMVFSSAVLYLRRTIIVRMDLEEARKKEEGFLLR